MSDLHHEGGGVEVREIAIASARSACDRWHSHLPPPLGGLFALGAFVGHQLVCVAVVSRPVARALDNGTTAEVVRLASDGSTRGAASAVLRACLARALGAGFDRVVSYTLLGERGACYRVAGWHETHVTRAQSWARAGRCRAAPAQPGRKVRWETGPRAAPFSRRAAKVLWRHVGKVKFVKRSPQQQELVS